MLLTAALCTLLCHAQDSDTLIQAVPVKLFDKTARAQQNMADNIQHQNEKLLKWVHAREERIYKHLYAIDSLQAKEIYAGVFSKIETIQQKISNPASITDAKQSGQYIPGIDSLKTMLKFLTPLVKNTQQAEQALASVEGLQAKLTQAEDIKSFITEREAALKNLLQSYTKLPTGITQSIGKYSKEFYYYKERIKGWKEELNNPEKIEKTALAILNKVPAFQKFWQQNSEIAGLFGSPAGAVGSLAGLQTRRSVMQELQQHFGAAEVNPQQLIQQNLGAAQAELNTLKDKANALRNGSISNGDGDMPDFKPNSQKTKSFPKRLEVGWNLQLGSNPIQSGGNFPAVNDLAISAGYKINDRFVAGVGVAYKFGLGAGWKHIDFTHEGVGFRSYIDWKISSPKKGLKVLFGNWWISGGFEINYRTAFKKIEQLENVSAWQQSGLIGVCKKIKANRKLLKQTKLQVFWDFLSYKHTPIGQPIIFRVGYDF